MFQPTISHFFKSSQSPPTSQTDSDQKVDKKIEATEIADDELIELLDSDSGSGLEHELIEASNTEKLKEVVSKKNIVNDENVSASRGGLVLNRKQTASVKQNQNKTDFADRLASIMNKRNAGSIIDNNSDDEVDPKALKKLKGNKLTDLDQQFKDLKLKHLETILCIRVGYKYKFFAKDAEIVSNILQIKLVPGKKTLDDSDINDKKYRKFQYCSIPDTRLHIHLQRLVFFNLKVAVVEQTETSALKKTNNSGTLFSREIKNIFTQVSYGVNEPFRMDGKQVLGDLNSIWALSVSETSKKRNVSLISANLNTGEIIYDQFSDDILLNTNLESRIRYLNPSEIITDIELPTKIKGIFSKLNENVQFYTSIKEEIPELFETLTDISLTDDMKKLISILHSYLATFENNKILYLSSNYSSFTSKNHMILPSNAIESLEIFENSTTGQVFGSFLWVMDHTRTPFGYKLLRQWISRPLIDITSINNRLDAVSCIISEVHHIFFESFNETLKKCLDLERSVNRIAYGNTSRREVYFFLKQISTFASLFKSHQSFIQNQLNSSNGNIRKKSSLLTDVLLNLNEFFINTTLPNLLSMINVDAALDKNREKNIVEFFNLVNYDTPEVLISKNRDIETVKTELEEELSNIRHILKRPMMNYKDTKDFLVEVRNSQMKMVPSDWVKVNSTKTVSRFKTPRTEQLVQKLQYHKDLLQVLAEKEFELFLKRIVDFYPLIKECIKNLSIYDCILSLAATSSNLNYTRPSLTSKPQSLNILNGRNPIIESLDVNYVSNDVKMTAEASKINIITGPNMGGKSSYIRQVALLVIMTQMGCYIPAEKAELSICDQILTRIGSHDDILASQSTFQVEMSEVLNILNSLTPRSLLLLDEVGRGTGTHDGLSISYAILKYFIELGERCPLVLFITHYSSLCDMDSPLIANYHMSFMEKQSPGEKWTSVIFLYKLTPGHADNSYGLNVAKLSNIPNKIINRAFDISQSQMKLAGNLDDLKLIGKIQHFIKCPFDNDNMEQLLKLIADT